MEENITSLPYKEDQASMVIGKQIRVRLKACPNVNKLARATADTSTMEVLQCGNCRIFLSIRFHVKSTLENFEVLKLTFFAILGVLNLDNLVHFSLSKVQKFIKLQASKI